MTTQEREVLKFTLEEFEYVQDEEGWEQVSTEHYDKRRGYDSWRYVVKNVGTDKFYSYIDEVYSGDYCAASPDEYELTQVFPVEVPATVYT